MIQACLNGSRPPGSHPALPLTPAELAWEGVRAVSAGAGSLHLHPRDVSGQESLASADLAAALSALRDACPGLPLGVSSGLWMFPDAATRLQTVQGWSILPDFVSVNWHEDGAEELAAHLLSRGIGVEAGLWTPEAARAFVRSPLAGRVLRVLVEIHDLPAPDAERAAHAVLNELSPPSGVPLLLHGAERSAWPLLRLAGSLGLLTRIGLEDTLTLPDGSPAPHNGALVEGALWLLGRA